MGLLEPEVFWKHYKTNLRATRAAWLGSGEGWTNVTKAAAVATIRTALPAAQTLADPEANSPSQTNQRRLEPSTEYFRVDVIGEEKLDPQPYNWVLRVAYEHENVTGKWRQEFCKLTQLVADLKVLVGYDDLDTIQSTLSQQIELLESCRPSGRDSRVSGGWLFIFGPPRRREGRFRVFKLDCSSGRALPVELHDAGDSLDTRAFPEI